MGRPWNLDESFDEFLHIFENPRCFGYTLTRAIWWFRFTCFNWNLWCSFLPPSIFSNVRTLNKLMRYEDRVRISTAIIMQLSTQIVYSIFLAPPCYLMQLEPTKLFRLLFLLWGVRLVRTLFQKARTPLQTAQASLHHLPCSKFIFFTMQVEECFPPRPAGMIHT